MESCRDILTFKPEYILNTKSRRIDCLVTKKPGTLPIEFLLAQKFRQYNLIDYKGPGESMSVINYYKVLSYAYSLPEHMGSANVLEELYIMLVTHYYPRRLIRHLNKKMAGAVEKAAPGMYDIHTEGIPVQIVVLPQLPKEECLWLGCLTNKLTEDIPLKKLADAYAPHKEDALYQRFMNAFIRANRSTKGDEDLMCEALYELFADELIKGRNEGRQEGRKEGRKEGMSRLSALNLKLISENRIAEIVRVSSDSAYRDELLEQYHL